MSDRIVANPKILAGKPCVKGARISVNMVLELVEAGISFKKIRTDFYPPLSVADIRACIAYARQIVQNEDLDVIVEDSP